MLEYSIKPDTNSRELQVQDRARDIYRYQGFIADEPLQGMRIASTSLCGTNTQHHQKEEAARQNFHCRILDLIDAATTPSVDLQSSFGIAPCIYRLHTCYGCLAGLPFKPPV